MGIVWTVVILGIMIFIHELGHFVSARAFKVHVEEFSMGMGPSIFKKKKGETLYSIRLLPLGGYCKMEGEDEAIQKEGSFSFLNPWKRLIILASGAFMNVLLAFILFILVSFNSGEEIVGTRIGKIVWDNAPISVFETGDKIVKMDNTKVNIYSDITLKMMENNGESIEITVLRDGEKVKKTVTPEKTENGYKLGFEPKLEKNTPLVALKNGIYETAFSVKSVYWSIKQMVMGKVGFEAVSGPVGVASVVSDVVESTGEIEDNFLRIRLLFLNIAYLMALIGANLGVMNLLPLPALDGGRILFTLVEIVIGRKVPERFEAAVHTAGFILLMLLALVVTWSDISKLL